MAEQGAMRPMLSRAVRLRSAGAARPLLAGLTRPVQAGAARPLLAGLTRPARAGAMRPVLTRRRAVDYCRVATAQCPAMPRQGVPA